MGPYETRLSDHDAKSIAVRERELSTEIMGEQSFAGALYYLWTGNDPSPGEERVLDAMLTSLMVHGVTPSSLVSRLTLLSEPDAVQVAVANAVGGVGSRYIGTMKECSAHLHELQSARDRETAIDDLVADCLERGERFPGIGHPHLDPVDPRAERLVELAEEGDVDGEFLAVLRRTRATFEAETGADLPINVTGAIAALTADMGLSPTAARGVAIVSRAAGVVGEVLEEQERPIADEIWQHVDENATGSRE